MSVIFSSRKDCYCAFCRSPRKIYSKRNIGWFEVMASALGSGALMYSIFQSFDPRAILIFVFFLALAETFVQIRWRLTIVCKYCGFDPVLYLKDSVKASARVKVHLDLRRQDPATLLARPLQLPKLPKEKAELLEKAQSASANLVSKRV